MTTSGKQNVMRQDHHVSNSATHRRANSDGLARGQLSGASPTKCKWSQQLDAEMHRFSARMKRSISGAALCSSGRATHSQQRRSNRGNLILSMLVGLLLAAIHSDAFGAGSTPATNLQSSGQSATATAVAAASGSTNQASAVKPQEPTSFNLIPVDQPVTSGQQAAAAPVRASKLQPEAGSEGASLRSPDTAGENGAPSMGDEPAASSAPSQETDDFAEPQLHYYTTSSGLADEQQQQQQQQFQRLVEQQQEVKQQPVAAFRPAPASQAVERRFGLFKKGQQQQQHYGAPAPMSANYAANPYAMSDCERCLAGFGQSAASGELQQLEPMLPPPPPPPPVSLPVQPALQLPGQQVHFGAMQPFGPLKSKFFMKFPFFVKPLAIDGHSSYGGQPSSHFFPPAPQFQSAHQPQATGVRPPMSSALYIRPAPSYNCIQASPPLLSAAASSQSQTSEPIPLGATKSSAGLKQQYAHQQVSYA